MTVYRKNLLIDPGFSARGLDTDGVIVSPDVSYPVHGGGSFWHPAPGPYRAITEEYPSVLIRGSRSIRLYVEHTQAIQFFPPFHQDFGRAANSIPLVTSKPTGIRIYPDVDNDVTPDKPVTRLYGHITLLGSGTRLEALNAEPIRARRAREIDRRDVTHSLNFAIPPVLALGDVPFSITLSDPNHVGQEDEYGATGFERLSFEPSAGINIIPFSVHYRGLHVSPVAWAEIRDYLAVTLPRAPVNWLFEFGDLEIDVTDADGINLSQDTLADRTNWNRLGALLRIRAQELLPRRSPVPNNSYLLALVPPIDGCAPPTGEPLDTGFFSTVAGTTTPDFTVVYRIKGVDQSRLVLPSLISLGRTNSANGEITGGEAALHELGHKLGRTHLVPPTCAGETAGSRDDSDPFCQPNESGCSVVCGFPEDRIESMQRIRAYGRFPRTSVGEVGYDPLRNLTFNPACTFDIMSYCHPCATPGVGCEIHCRGRMAGEEDASRSLRGLSTWVSPDFFEAVKG